MNPQTAAFLNAFRAPDAVLALEVPAWNDLLRLATRWQLLPLWAERLRDRGLFPRIPERVRELLEGGIARAEAQRRGTLWEVDRVARALRGVDGPVVALKGGAYILAGLPPGRGRLLSDLDILVPRDRLGAVEHALKVHGWASLMPDGYDDHYYRHWTHELPPMQHAGRRAELDVHHTILPPLGNLRPPPALLFEAARPVPGSRLLVLAPEDMVLHSATHLFQDGELGGGIRDLSDLDLLLRHFGDSEPGFWDRLVPRAEALHLTRPLYYALRYARRLLQTPVDNRAAAAADRHRPPGAVAGLMDLLIERALLPPDVDSYRWDMDLAASLLLLRGHWLKMPVPILARHLTHQALRRWRKRRDPA